MFLFYNINIFFLFVIYIFNKYNNVTVTINRQSTCTSVFCKWVFYGQIIIQIPSKVINPVFPLSYHTTFHWLINSPFTYHNQLQLALLLLFRKNSRSSQADPYSVEANFSQNLQFSFIEFQSSPLTYHLPSNVFIFHLK